MNKNKLVVIVPTLLLLASCGASSVSSSSSSDSLISSSTSNSVSSSSSASSTDSMSSSTSESSSSSSTSSSSSSSQSYVYDERLNGDWFNHSDGGTVIPVNAKFTFSKGGSLAIGNVTFSYVGLYDGYEETNLFKNASGTMAFIASYDDSDPTDIVVNWAFASSSTNEMGVARREEYESGLKYSYVGSEWPMEMIKETLPPQAMSFLM